ncbi:hypothetical protein INS49_010594 [Diaporthe citri]|uniref:uncharacterized protein n=1 Tax=Diaporthe citri TaxID=83186 RepID=UPI001C8160D2|nr:uncharacterized protein INS49_010594 [Diaporthe citri]KAG6362364.1 hypothetical protein INS49_010594 [Diaporthe citri]
MQLLPFILAISNSMVIGQFLVNTFDSESDCDGQCPELKKGRLSLQLDRGNIMISQALSDNMLKDLGLTTNQYNHGVMIFYLCFLSAEVPSQMISKKLGPDVWIPIQMVTWSVIGICQGFITGEKTSYTTRALLGLVEGGFIPDAIPYLSYFYKNTEMPVRMSYFYCSS